jgi:hypothetical protein
MLKQWIETLGLPAEYQVLALRRRALRPEGSKLPNMAALFMERVDV